MKNYYLGVEFGSTRIKTVVIDETYNKIDESGYSWESSYIDGFWTYPLSDAEEGLKSVLRELKYHDYKAIGISGMMHGYLAFDENWCLLVPFRTWQNNCTKVAAEYLSSKFKFNIPQRWSIAHFFQAVLNEEEHVKKVRHITTLAGYFHHLLSGENIVGIGEASGMFPVDPATKNYNDKMIDIFNHELSSRGIEIDIRDILPEIRIAGKSVSYVNRKGSLVVDSLIKEGTIIVPCEGDAQTGMIATNSVAKGTGNVSAGTSIFAMIVLDKSMSNKHSEIDIVMTPNGNEVAMIHCNNCSSELNNWIKLFSEYNELFGLSVKKDVLYEKLFNCSLEGDKNCGNIFVCNYITGENITDIEEGSPFVIRTGKSSLTLANFIKSQIVSMFGTLKFGMEILKEEQIKIDNLVCHGGIFKTPKIAQNILTSALNIKTSVMINAESGGPYGMALLAAFASEKEQNLESFLNEKVFSIISNRSCKCMLVCSS